MGGLIGLDLPHISLAAEKVVDLGFMSITNSTIMMLLAMVVVVAFMARTAGRATLLPGGRWQLLGETVVEWLLGLAEGIAGRQLGRRIFPLIATLFIFIIVANWMALVPGVGTIGFYHEVHAVADDHAATPAEKGKEATAEKGKEPAAATGQAEDDHGERVFVPFLRAANADLNMTVAMAIVSFVTIQGIGIMRHGVGGYLKELATPWFLFPIHIISELSRILSLSARLFGNIFGGEVFVVVILFLFPLIIPAIPLGLEVFFGFIQAVLFSVLTLVYVSLAAAGHGSHDEEHGHAEHHAPATTGAGSH
jgi:F-type H+-transporting ATPase subunit a